MCGIYGYIGKPTTKTIRALRILGILNEERGKDSAGIAVANGREIGLYKKAVNSSKFFGKETTRQLLWKYKHSEFITVIGHTRAATIGAVNDKNAHPYRIGRWLFAHNGMIQNFYNLQLIYKTDYQVDSQIIGYLLNLYDERRVFEQLVSGWFTVPYMDIGNHTQLNIAKSGAPLALAYLPNGKGIFYSSLKEHLEEALAIARIVASIGSTTTSKIYRFQWHYDYIETTKEKLYTQHTYSAWDSLRGRFWWAD